MENSRTNRFPVGIDLRNGFFALEQRQTPN